MKEGAIIHRPAVQMRSAKQSASCAAEMQDAAGFSLTRITGRCPASFGLPGKKEGDRNLLSAFFNFHTAEKQTAVCCCRRSLPKRRETVFGI